MQRLTDRQRLYVAAVRAFAAEQGHADVPRTLSRPELNSLGAWVSARRFERNHGRGSKAVQTALEGIPGWTWSSQRVPSAPQTIRGIREFSTYYAEHGSGDIPYNHVTGFKFALGRWVSRARSRFRSGEISSITVDMLNATPGWTWEATGKPAKFNTNLQDGVRAFAAEHGHTNIPSSLVEESGYRLGQAVVNARSRYRAGTLRESLREALERIPEWTWGRAARPPSQFMAALDEFIATHGHSMMPATYVTPTGYHLGHAVWAIRRNPDGVSELLRSQLNGRSEWTWQKYQPVNRHRRLRDLQQFGAEHGHANVPQRYQTESGVNLGEYVKDVRKRYRRGLLSDDTIREFEQLPGWVWVASRKNRVLRDGRIEG